MATKETVPSESIVTLMVVNETNGKYEVNIFDRKAVLKNLSSSIVQIKLTEIDHRSLTVGFYDGYKITFVQIVDIGTKLLVFRLRENILVGGKPEASFAIQKNGARGMAVVYSTKTGIVYKHRVRLFNTPAYPRKTSDDDSSASVIAFAIAVPIGVCCICFIIAYIMYEQGKKNKVTRAGDATREVPNYARQVPIPMDTTPEVPMKAVETPAEC